MAEKASQVHVLTSVTCKFLKENRGFPTVTHKGHASFFRKLLTCDSVTCDRNLLLAIATSDLRSPLPTYDRNSPLAIATYNLRFRLAG